MEVLTNRRQKATLVSIYQYRASGSTLGMDSRRLAMKSLRLVMMSLQQNRKPAHKSGTTSAETSSKASRDATNLRRTRLDSHSTTLVSMILSIALGHGVADNFLPAGYSSKNDPYQPASGGADGSLLLSDDENSRQINDPMQRFRDFLLPKYQKYASDDVSAADFVQAAGSIGVASCPGGPIIKTVSTAWTTTKKRKTGRITCTYSPKGHRTFRFDKSCP
jgi:hypothetical protein